MVYVGGSLEVTREDSKVGNKGSLRCVVGAF